MLLDWIRRGRLRRDAAHALYAHVVRQARSPVLYGAYGVPDTLDGRFDLIVVHVHLALRRLRRERPGRPLSQALFDVLFADMDRSLREIGVSDHSIGRKMKDMVKAFYGRIAAYDVAFDDPEALAAALLRNVWREAEERREEARRLAAYVRRQAAFLEGQPLAALERGELLFAPEELR